MLNIITKGYVWAKVNTNAFIKDSRGDIVQYVMIVALAGILIATVKEPMTKMIGELIEHAKTTVTTGTKVP